MSGFTRRILDRTDYSFTVGAVAQSITVVIARKIDTSWWREGVIIARLHASASWPAAAVIKVLIAPDGYTDEDPGLIWNVTTTQLIAFTQGVDTPPTDKNAELTAPFGPMV